jgi:hypothetical protein
LERNGGAPEIKGETEKFQKTIAITSGEKCYTGKSQTKKCKLKKPLTFRARNFRKYNLF